MLCCICTSPIDAAKTSTEISYNIYAVAQVGTPFKVNATLHEIGNPRPLNTGAKIKVTVINPQGASNTTFDASINTHGNYVFTVTPAEVYMMTIQMDYAGDSTYSPAFKKFDIPVIPIFRPGEPPSGSTAKLTANMKRSDLIIGMVANMTAKLEPPVAGAVLKFTITEREGSPRIFTVSTTVSGSYFLLYKPDKTGPWSFQASWVGDETHAALTSNPIYFMVLAHEDVDTTIQYRVVEKIAAAPDISGVNITSTVYPDGASRISVITTSGTHSFHKMTPGRYNLTFSKSGYISVTDSFTINEGDHIQRNIYLAKVGSEPTGGNSLIKDIPGYPVESILFGLFVVVARAQVCRFD
jgi:hypothetical protein